MELSDLLGLQPVSVANEGQLRELARRHAAHNPLPRFFLSPSYLAAYQDAFGIMEIGDCLVLVKRRQIMGNPAIYLIVPPQHVHGSAAAERDVIESLRHLGVSTMLDTHDIERYGYGLDEVTAAGLWGNEYVYDAAEYASLAGASHKNTRATMNRLLRRSGAVLSTYKVPPLGDLEALARTWQAQTGRHASEIKVARQWHDHASRGASNRHASAIYYCGRMVAYSLTEEVSPGRVVIVARLRDYDFTQVPDATLALHVMDSVVWPGGTLMTIGAAGTASLAAHKQKLRPVAILAVHKLVTSRKLTMEEFKETKPCATMTTRLF